MGGIGALAAVIIVLLIFLLLLRHKCPINRFLLNNIISNKGFVSTVTCLMRETRSEIHSLRMRIICRLGAGPRGLLSYIRRGVCRFAGRSPFSVPA